MTPERAAEIRQRRAQTWAWKMVVDGHVPACALDVTARWNVMKCTPQRWKSYAIRTRRRKRLLRARGIPDPLASLYAL